MNDIKAVKKPKKNISKGKKDSLAGFLFAAPWLFGTLFFFVYPFIMVFIYSFNSVDLANDFALKFTGFESYIKVFTSDSQFVRGFVESIVGIFVDSLFIICFSMFVALILKSKFRGRTLVRAIFFLPVIIASGPVLSIINNEDIASLLMSGGRSSLLFEVGSMEDFLIGFGIPHKVIETFLTIISGIFNLSWKSGIQILLFLAGLQNVPGHLYEAAEVEGASKWEIFWRVTFPMISSILLLNTVYTVIDGFTDYSNPTIKMIMEYTIGINLNLSYGSALGVSYLAIVFLIIGAIYLLISRKTFYSEK